MSDILCIPNLTLKFEKLVGVTLRYKPIASTLKWTKIAEFIVLLFIYLNMSENFPATYLRVLKKQPS